MSHNTSLVNLSIPQEVTQPIVAAKIQDAVLAGLTGTFSGEKDMLPKITIEFTAKNNNRW